MRIPKARTGPVCDFDRTVTPMVDVVFQLLVFFVLASGGRVAEQSLSTMLVSGQCRRSPASDGFRRRTRPGTLAAPPPRHRRHANTDVRVNDGPTGEVGLLPANAPLRQGGSTQRAT